MVIKMNLALFKRCFNALWGMGQSRFRINCLLVDHLNEPPVAFFTFRGSVLRGKLNLPMLYNIVRNFRKIYGIKHLV